MTLSVYFAKPSDTEIAASDPAFASALANRVASFHHNGDSMLVVDDPDDADLVVIDERYEYRTWRYADTLSSCEFVKRHVNRILVVNHDSYARVFLPGIYASLENHNLSRTIALSGPYKRDLWQVPLPPSNRISPVRLFSFRGTLHTHPVRRTLFGILAGHPDGDVSELRKAFHSHTAADQNDYIQHILSAKFVICPRGLSSNSYRLFETMQLGRCPVVVSDGWIPPRGPDWQTFSIQVPESEVSTIPQRLKEVEHRAGEMGRLAASNWSRFFGWPARLDYFLGQLVDLHWDRSALPRQEFSECLRYWKSADFKRLYRWTLLGRLCQRLQRSFLAEPPR